MEMLLLDPWTIREIIRDRRDRRSNRRDEVWDGVYVAYPLPDVEHQDLIGQIATVFQMCVGFLGLGRIRTCVGISDREKRWVKNYRIPDLGVFLKETKAINLSSHWLGGPDFAIEIISKHDRSREKMDFYAKVGVQELLLVDRNPWALELYRLGEGVFHLVGKSTLADPAILTSEVVPLSFQLEPGELRATIAMIHSDGVQRWSA